MVANFYVFLFHFAQTVMDECMESDTCTETFKTVTPPPECEVDTPTVTPPEPICRKGDWQNNLPPLPTPTFTDQCYDVSEGTITPSVSGTNALCPQENQGGGDVSIQYSFEYSRDEAESCVDSTSCGYDVTVQCSDDTAYGYRQQGEDAGTLYKNKEDGISSRWAWGEYFPNGAPNEDLNYDMYGGCPSEDPLNAQCTFLGTITVHPLTGDVTAYPCSYTNFNSGQFGTERPHVEISAPSADYCTKPNGQAANAYQIPGTDLCCRDIGVPGQMVNRHYETDNDNVAAACTAGQPCCVAVHWQTTYDAGCKSEKECNGDLADPIVLFPQPTMP